MNFERGSDLSSDLNSEIRSSISASGVFTFDHTGNRCHVPLLCVTEYLSHTFKL